MDTKDHLLAGLGEECGEVQHVVGKALRFGLLDINPHTKCTNIHELKKEVHDLIAMYEMVRDICSLPRDIDRDMIEAKKNKFLKYLEYSDEVGRLDD